MPENNSFVQCYRGLVGTMRLAPEPSAKQLTEILQRVGRLRQQGPDAGSLSDRRTSHE